MSEAIRVAAAVLALNFACGAQGGVAFSNLGPGGTFVARWFYGGGFLYPNATTELAFAFTSTSTGEVSLLRAALFQDQYSPNPTMVTARLYTDENGEPSALLGSWTFRVEYRNSSDNLARTFNLTPTAFVREGSSYFLSVQQVPPLFEYWTWWAPAQDVGPDVPVAYRASGVGPWTLDSSSMPAFELQTSDCGSPDFNDDGDIGTDTDIAAFFACLGGSCCSTCGSADFNGDGDVGTDADIEAFFRVLAGGSC